MRAHSLENIIFHSKDFTINSFSFPTLYFSFSMKNHRDDQFVLIFRIKSSQIFWRLERFHLCHLYNSSPRAFISWNQLLSKKRCHYVSQAKRKELTSSLSVRVAVRTANGTYYAENTFLIRKLNLAYNQYSITNIKLYKNLLSYHTCYSPEANHTRPDMNLRFDFQFSRFSFKLENYFPPK